MVTLKDVARRAGVSRSAVSRTFTEGASVSKKMRLKVEKAANELGYSPNFIARGLTTRRTKLIGLVADNFHNPVFLQIFDLFTRGLQDRGLRPLLVNLSGETSPKYSVQMLKQYSVDGVIIASSTLPPSFAHAFRQAAVPVVHSFGRCTNNPEVHIVGIDNQSCGRMAAKTLIARGYSSVGFLGGPATATSTQDRHAGFAAEMAKHPEIPCHISFSKAYTFAAGFEKMSQLLQQEHAEAYFCGDDVLSIGAISAITTAGLSVPGDIGIIGLNDMEIAGWQNINLTTIQQPVEQIIILSVKLIVDILQNPNQAPENFLFQCQIIERDTLKPVPLKKT